MHAPPSPDPMDPGQVERAEGLYHVLSPPGSPLPIPALELARALAPLTGQHPTDLALELRAGGGWLARDVDRDALGSYERVLAAAGVAVCIVSAEGLPEEPPVRRVRRAHLFDEAIHVEWAACASEMPLAEVSILDLMVVGAPLPDTESRSRWANRPRRKRGTADAALAPALHRMARPDENLPGASWRAALERLELAQPRLLLAVGTNAPLAVYVFEPGTQFPDYPLLGTHSALGCLLAFIDELFTGPAGGRVLPAARRAWEQRDFAGILHHRRDTVDRRLAWVQQVLAHGLWEGSR